MKTSVVFFLCIFYVLILCFYVYCLADSVIWKEVGDRLALDQEADGLQVSVE